MIIHTFDDQTNDVDFIINKRSCNSSFFYRPCVDLVLVDDAEFEQKQSSDDCVIISKRRP